MNDGFKSGPRMEANVRECFLCEFSRVAGRVCGLGGNHFAAESAEWTRNFVFGLYPLIDANERECFLICVVREVTDWTVDLWSYPQRQRISYVQY